LLIMFVIWTLIIRTCYQSFLYANLQEDMRRPRVKNIDELNEQNFTLLYEHNLDDQDSRMDEHFRQVRFAFSSHNHKFYSLVQRHRMKLLLVVEDIPDIDVFAEYQNKVTMLTLRKAFHILVLQDAKKIPSLHLIDDNMPTIHFSLMFFKPNSMNKIFISTIDRLFESGFVKHFEASRNFVHGKTFLNDQEPQVLSMDHLGVCFVAITIFLALSCVVFIIECLKKYFDDFLQKGRNK
jgi:hypothetical protein